MKIDFVTDWRFKVAGKEWQNISLPHDAMLCEKRDAKCHNGKQSGYFPGGKYIYEKDFEIKNEDTDKNMQLLFEGVYQNCKVYINENEVASHKYGYTEFIVDISAFITEGKNTVKVTVDNSLEPNCRWYSGSGIYRNVSLLIDEPVAPVISTKSINPAIIEVRCDSETKIEIFDGSSSVYKGIGGEIEIPNAKLWSNETPHLYTCVAKKGNLSSETRFGIRLLEWDAENGLCINGKRVLLRGGCIHHDNGVLGACGFAEAEKRRVRILKEAGYNAIRSAHNPMSRAMLDACDELGVYVMDECFDGWYTPKNYHDYSTVDLPQHKSPLYLRFNGTGKFNFHELKFEKRE